MAFFHPSPEEKRKAQLEGSDPQGIGIKKKQKRSAMKKKQKRSADGWKKQQARMAFFHPSPEEERKAQIEGSVPQGIGMKKKQKRSADGWKKQQARKAFFHPSPEGKKSSDNAGIY